MIAGNSSINLTLDDTANTASVGITTKGLSVNINSNLYKLGEYSTKGLFIDTNNQTYQLGFAGSNLELNINAASQIFKLGNSSAGTGLYIDLVNNTYYLGNGLKALVVNTTSNTYTLGTNIEGLYINTSTDVFKLGNYVSNTGLIISSNIANLGTLTTGLEVDSTTGNVKTKVAGLTTGIFLDVAGNEFVFGTDVETPANASYFGARGTGGATPSIVMTQDFVDTPAPPAPAEFIRVRVDGLGDRWIQLYQ